MNRNTDPIPYSRPELGAEEEQAVLEVLRSGWLTTGKRTLDFEREFALAAAPGGEYRALAVSSATAGLHIGIRALNLPPGSAVALSPYTFAASINSILYNGLEPLLVDCLPGGYHLDPAALEAAITRRGKKTLVRSNSAARRSGLAGLAGRARELRAVMPVHFAGWEEGGQEIDEIASACGLEVIEDAAHSYPARRTDRGTYAQGTRGRFGVFSFYANKTITTGEGGMILTADHELAKRITSYRLHGISREVWDRYTSDKPSYHYDIELPGYKYNLPDILSAIGLVQLRRAEQLAERRRKIAMGYAAAFADRDWIIPPPGSQNEIPRSHSWHIYSLRLVLPRLSITRDEFICLLSERGIGSSVHFIPLHLMSYYRKRFGFKPGQFPRAMEAFESTISLPMFPGLDEDEMRRVIDEVLEIGDTHYRGA